MQEKEYFRQQVKELKERIVQLEEDRQAQQENLAAREEVEKIRNADFERLKRENAILNRQQKQKDGCDTALVNLLKEQVNINFSLVYVLLNINSQFTVTMSRFFERYRVAQQTFNWLNSFY